MDERVRTTMRQLRRKLSTINNELRSLEVVRQRQVDNCAWRYMRVAQKKISELARARRVIREQLAALRSAE